MGVGFPATLKLHEFGSQIWAAFGSPPYHVGSSVFNKIWRDVDVRMIVDDAHWAALGFGDPASPQDCEKWIAYCRAFSALGAEMTGLPIDFQIQQRTQANLEFNGPRSAIGIIPLRRK